jgi:hypothetical protein
MQQLNKITIFSFSSFAQPQSKCLLKYIFNFNFFSKRIPPYAYPDGFDLAIRKLLHLLGGRRRRCHRAKPPGHYINKILVLLWHRALAAWCNGHRNSQRTRRSWVRVSTGYKVSVFTYASCSVWVFEENKWPEY